MPEWQYGAGPFGDRDEGVGGEQPARLMVPPDQRLKPDNASRGELDLGLVVEFKLTLLDRGSELIGDAHPFMHLKVEVLAMEAVTVAALVLGAATILLRYSSRPFCRTAA